MLLNWDRLFPPAPLGPPGHALTGYSLRSLLDISEKMEAVGEEFNIVLESAPPCEFECPCSECQYVPVTSADALDAAGGGGVVSGTGGPSAPFNKAPSKPPRKNEERARDKGKGKAATEAPSNAHSSKQDPKRLSSTHALPHVGAKRHCRVTDSAQYITIDD